MATKEILIAARKLIEKEENWTTGTYARTKEGYSTGPNNPQAACWCAVGAVKCVCLRTETATMQVLDQAAQEAFGVWWYASLVNDAKGHAAVLGMYDRAIAACC